MKIKIVKLTSVTVTLCTRISFYSSLVFNFTEEIFNKKFLFFFFLGMTFKTFTKVENNYFVLFWVLECLTCTYFLVFLSDLVQYVRCIVSYAKCKALELIRNLGKQKVHFVY